MSFELHVPEGWSQVKLSDLGEVNRGRSRHRPRDAAHLYGGPYPFVQTGDVKASKGRITQHSQTYSEDGLAQSRLWPKGTMCITIAANIAETGILTYPACFPDSVIGFIADESKCNVYFIEYVFRLLRKRIQAQATGSVQDNINLQTLERLLFPIPALEEQNRIAAVLGELDDKIHLNYEINQTLEEMAQAIFKSWFVDFDPVKAKMNGEQPEGMDAATASLFPDKLVESESGLIPDGWEVLESQKVATVAIGKTPPRKEPQWFSENPSNVTWISIKDMGNAGTYALDSSEYLTPEAVDKFNVKVIPDNTLILSFKLTVGRVAITHGEMTTNEAIAHYKLADDARVSTNFLYSYMKQFNFESLGSTSSIAKAVNSKIIKALPVIVPSKEILDNFDTLVKPLFDKIKSNQMENQNLEALRDTLLPKLLSGEIELAETSKTIK
ncbi:MULTISPECIES: restriction endonuclease subunit S [unclassified Vibrio]|uniref:restriction endonuclease subunit S n=1 Tax=unclassified Vibrio TaxID=2614977 RepID=UPI002658CB7E|nr:MULTISPECIES: restriction endonuclease subunit S [unclassified Vibrio]MCR9607794.1 restriction endonuclease subunit S [Vibrio alginolyticus]MCR9612037.1 restriction endonuclease subunit S [Vibrio alginolyticus]MDW1583342.1 restriction endonuclease subunit S [Vibrio sp. Vb2897]MDW1588626.1 restriction endonuclease subunit S [Vibrio sp. Vb2910]MDW1597855.1 restriction endonuclease subunit S [Vibrio sp. Vb2911]